MVNEIHLSLQLLFLNKNEIYIYIYIYIYMLFVKILFDILFALFYLLPMTIDKISSVHENFSINEKFWAVSEIDAGGQ